MDEITARLGLDKSSLATGLREAKAEVREGAIGMRDAFKDTMKELAAPLMGIGTMAGLEKLFGTVDQIERVAAAAGFGAEEFQRLSYAASEAGVSSDALETATEFLSKSIGLAKDGTKEYAEVFQRWGIAIKNSIGDLRQAPEILDEIADKMKAIKDPAEQAAMAQDLLGRSGKQLIAIMSEGSAAMHARGAGAAVFSDEDIANVKEAHQEILKLTNTLTVVGGWALSGLASGAQKWGSVTVGSGQQNADNAATVDTLRKIAKMKEDTQARIAARDKLAWDEETKRLKDIEKNREHLHEIVLEVEREKKEHQRELAAAHRADEEKAREAARKKIELEDAAAQRQLTLAQVEAHKDSPYYHTLQELAGNSMWAPASNVAWTAREIIQRQRRLSEYTFQHGANAGDSYFTGERDYINSLKSSLEKAGYTTPELTMEKMQDHLQKIAERMTEAGGLPVAPVLAP